jgi:enoyl-CoA hydratase/carnithine racemase
VLSGEGRAFCAGLDFTVFESMSGTSRPGPRPAAGSGDATSGPLGQDGPAAAEGPGPASGLPLSLVGRDGRITNRGQQASYVWSEMPAPVIAALHGHVLGGGLQLALGADIRIVAPDATLSVLEVRWGLVPDMTGTQLLPSLVGLDVAKELTFTGRMVSGTEAVQLGLATRLSDTPLDDARALAVEIAGKNPEAIRGAKALFNAAGTRPLLDAFVDESTRMASILGSPNQLEAVAAQLGGRLPVFSDEY